MIDTIVLSIPHTHFEITHHERFSPSSVGLFKRPYYTLGGRGNFSCYQNPTKEELRQGLYKPRLTITRRIAPGGFIVVLKVEFSAPKMIFGNNFDEIEEEQFDELVCELGSALVRMGVGIEKRHLVKAPVSGIHFSKNVLLRDFSTPQSILREIAKCDVSKHIDVNQTDYRNEGHCLKFHTNGHELALYDKVKDLQKAKGSEKRAIEKDNAVQLELFNRLPSEEPFEVLRIEARLNNKNVIKSALERVGVPDTQLTFAALFRKHISQGVLHDHVRSLKAGYTPSFSRKISAADYIAGFRMDHPKVKMRKMLQAYGLYCATEQMGVRPFREAYAIVWIKPMGAG